MRDERLSEVTRSVSLLARWSPTSTASGPDGITEEEEPEVGGPTMPCANMLCRLSGPMVYGRVWEARRRTASRCSRALPLADGGEEEDDAVAAVAMATGGGAATE